MLSAVHKSPIVALRLSFSSGLSASIFNVNPVGLFLSTDEFIGLVASDVISSVYVIPLSVEYLNFQVPKGPGEVHIILRITD